MKRVEECPEHVSTAHVVVMIFLELRKYFNLPLRSELLKNRFISSLSIPKMKKNMTVSVSQALCLRSGTLLICWEYVINV